MRKLAEVQAAKELMKDAMEWSSFKWLWEKRRVRQTADAANAALDRLERSIKAKWSDDCRVMYKKLSGKKAPRETEGEGRPPEALAPDMKLLLEQVLEADHAAKQARQAAEEAFEEAERRMSTDLAREGCKKAIHSWELYEKAIRKAEAATKETPAGEPGRPKA